jgi:hypothetical protein
MMTAPVERSQLRRLVDNDRQIPQHCMAAKKKSATAPPATSPRPAAAAPTRPIEQVEQHRAAQPRARVRAGNMSNSSL